MALPSFRARALAWAFVCLDTFPMYFAYLDEFGHDGPFVSRKHPRHNASPVFGLAGFVMPADNVRRFGSWFFQRKCALLAWEISRSQKPAWQWEKKGARLYTVKNVKSYYQLRNFTIRFLKTIRQFDGFVFYFGRKKTEPPEIHNSTALYKSVLRESIKRIDQFCEKVCTPPENFVLLMDEHTRRSSLLTQAAQSMYGRPNQRKRLIEQPFQLESERYQNLQAADWIAGLVGRLEALRANPMEYQENEVFKRFFEHDLSRTQRRSRIWH